MTRSLETRLEEQDIPAELTLLINSIMKGCLQIASLASSAYQEDILGDSGITNVQGESQKKLDTLSNEILKDTIINTGVARALASEEEETVVECDGEASYLVCFDPLDGSSNIDVNGSIGTIFSIMSVEKGCDWNESSFLRSGRAIVSAGYVLYGASTVAAISVGKGTDLYALDNIEKAFLLTNPGVQIPTHSNEVALNMLNQRLWDDGFKAYVEDLVQGSEGPRKIDFKMRWFASMVGDLHRIFVRGGCFAYPRLRSSHGWRAKLRILYEGAPMAFLIEQAGGSATNGFESILDVVPSNIHQRDAVIVGSNEEVAICASYIQGLC